MTVTTTTAIDVSVVTSEAVLGANDFRVHIR